MIEDAGWGLIVFGILNIWWLDRWVASIEPPTSHPWVTAFLVRGIVYCSWITITLGVYLVVVR